MDKRDGKEKKVNELMNPSDVQAMRVAYTKGELSENDCPDDPWQLFNEWFHEARGSDQKEANAMVLSTIDEDGLPNSRVVLMKSFEDGCISFYTNLESKKADELNRSGAAALVFHWAQLERQVRARGTVSRVPDLEAKAYFKTRPRESQLGAWSSAQSSIVQSRSILLENYKKYEDRFPQDVPMPEFWGGFRVSIFEFEFWQGRIGRLHDRIQYSKQSGKWQQARLSP